MSSRILTGVAAAAACLALIAVHPGAAAAAPRIDPASPAPLITPHGARGSSANTSLNWSGYSVSGGTSTSVTATWAQPVVVAKSAETYAAFWVGLDGDGSEAVEEIGTTGYANVRWLSGTSYKLTLLDQTTGSSQETQAAC